jgi:hypothetical protein
MANYDEKLLFKLLLKVSHGLAEPPIPVTHEYAYALEAEYAVLMWPAKLIVTDRGREWMQSYLEKSDEHNE